MRPTPCGPVPALLSSACSAVKKALELEGVALALAATVAAVTTVTEMARGTDVMSTSFLGKAKSTGLPLRRHPKGLLHLQLR
mmetsp:Transcript_10155/g.28980  ORF Transcript_10155/g.28980 Transcript_10155/m.28980 type:complete len:82 (+) Transcript_10155:663-908(+)